MTGAPAHRVAVVIPCYKVTRHILGVLAAIGPEVSLVVCVDDACPDLSGDLIERDCQDPRVRVARHAVNQGVGGAVLTGYGICVEAGADIIVKIDGDGQMDPRALPALVEPIVSGAADYTKGNRFFHIDDLSGMPPARLFGNAALSFLTKLSSGYWSLFDPTNGYTAIHARVAALLRGDKIAKRFFFESDMLFHLGLERAVVRDVSMPARYGNEVSNLHIRAIILPYLHGHLRNTLLRLVYTYFIRDFSIASLEIAAGLPAVLFGVIYGALNWIHSAEAGVPSTAGTVMLAALPTILGLQMLFSAINYDVQNTPQHPLHRQIGLHGAGARARRAVSPPDPR